MEGASPADATVASPIVGDDVAGGASYVQHGKGGDEVDAASANGAAAAPAIGITPE